MISLIGILLLFVIAYALSSKRKAINWRTVGGAFVIQALLAAFVLYVPLGIEFLLLLTDGVSAVLGYGQTGIDFVFGAVGNKSLGFIIAFNVLPIIVFFSSFITVLYHLGVMTWVIRVLGGFLQMVLKTSRPESMSAAANIFVGQSEAPLVVRPFIPHMTRSELFAVMVGGLASIAGSVMAGYAGMGVELKYLIAASFMAAPGGLMMAKMIIPEQDAAKNDVAELKSENMTYVNIFDAAASGAASGMKLALNVGAMLLAFVALIAMLNGIIGKIGSFVGMPELTFQFILGYLLQPLAWVLGVPWEESNAVGSLIGQKFIVNEFVAYLNFMDLRAGLSEQTQGIVTFALCGFANLSSIAILMGGVGSMAPNRRQEIAQLGLKAVFAATLANLMSAALAGLFLSL